MYRYQKLAVHILLFLVFVAFAANLELVFGGKLQTWNLPVFYLIYLLGTSVFYKIRGHKITRFSIAIAIILPIALLIVAKGLSYCYDTSWDGQEYQQSGVIALSQGWNPWHSNSLPIQVPAGEKYVLGYPKTTWLIQATVYKFTGKLQSAPITNIAVSFASALLVLGLLRRLKIDNKWCWIISFLAVAQIHFLQQLPTFMADGYSYELSLAAIASLILLMLERDKRLPLVAFLCSWILLAGAKFSNLFICAVLGAAALIYFYKIQIFSQKQLLKIIAVFAIIGGLILWVPYGKNILTYHSLVYPQNQAGESAKLRFDNVPNNLKKDNRVALLFYGIFSGTEPSIAGNPTSTYNVARLKLPFTFKKFEIHEVNNFQGRVGSGGFLFSGIFLVTILLFAALLWRRPQFAAPHILAGGIVLASLIIISALIIPVPNKLRYSPLITLLPVIVLTLLLNIKNKKMWVKIASFAITVLLCLNILVSLSSLITGRVRDSRAISTQLKTLRESGKTYDVQVANFYSHYVRLQEGGVHFVPVKKLTCPNPQELQFSYGTTLFCAKS